MQRMLGPLPTHPVRSSPEKPFLRLGCDMWKPTHYEAHRHLFNITRGNNARLTDQRDKMLQYQKLHQCNAMGQEKKKEVVVSKKKKWAPSMNRLLSQTNRAPECAHVCQWHTVSQVQHLLHIVRKSASEEFLQLLSLLLHVWLFVTCKEFPQVGCKGLKGLLEEVRYNIIGCIVTDNSICTPVNPHWSDPLMCITGNVETRQISIETKTNL